MFVNTIAGNKYQGALSADGEYTVQVFLMRNAARRNETAHIILISGLMELDRLLAG